MSFDRESIVYGCIKDLPFGTEEERKARFRYNRRVIENLPTAEGWPFLCQEMFSVPGDDIFTGTYQTQVIHFGASYRAIEYEWELWLEKFESVLKQMYWVNAIVHLETELSGNHTFFWEAAENFHQPGNEELRVRCEWQREALLDSA